TISGTLHIASGPATTGRVTLQGGALTAAAIQMNNGGAFTQTGGALNFGSFTQRDGVTTIGSPTNPISSFVGAPAFPNAPLTLSGGLLHVTGNTIVSNLGKGTFIQSGGTHLTGFLYVGYAGTGSYQMNGGTLTVNANMFLGYNGGASGTFTQYGGSARADSV